MNLTATMRTALTALLTLSAPASRSDTPRPLPHRHFGTSRASVEAVLARPYDSEVPFGGSGETTWATSPQGWAFRDSVHLIYLDPKDSAGVFDLVVQSGDTRYVVDKAEYTPSHVHMIGAPGSEITASASFTFATDKPDNPLSRPFTPEKRWTCWSSGRREDTFAVDFGQPRKLWGCDLYFFSDVERGGGCAPPEDVRVERFHNGVWQAISTRPFTPHEGKTNIAFQGVAPTQTSQIRFTFRNRGEKLYTGLYGVEPAFADAAEQGKKETGKAQALSVVGDKWITNDDVLVTLLTVRNAAKTKQPFFVRMASPLNGRQGGYEDQRDIQGVPLYLSASGTDGKTQNTRFIADIAPGETRRFTFACAVGHTRSEADVKLNQSLHQAEPLKAQQGAYQGWFDENTAYFTCSDPLVAKMYAHRWYNVKKNSMYPRLGHLNHRAFAEGRWTSDWYTNVISYGAGHQIDEARWLRDPSYAWGQVQTWAENPRPDGLLPGRVGVKGQLGGQYTEWIPATAWDAYLVHPDKTILAKVADPLATDALTWFKLYGWNNSPLLAVDSHWWTGMEWQPSFFSFAGYQTGGGSGEDRKFMTPLRRVDLTAYNYANAQATANIYHALERNADALPLQKLADDTRAQTLAQMWNPHTHWFHSLRASDGVPSPTKEIIGVYPFAFDLPTRGKDYETVWNAALDPAQFWTTWPLASVSKDCPAFAQNGWPVGPGGSICMWNGPSWPHADSLVMAAMANTLRHYDADKTALSRQKLLDLFLNFTRVQYKNQNPLYPWTGEYYNGDTGEWKTEQRDYNHSTWIDPLIRDFIGLIPRNDDVLEIDSLLPPGAWPYYVLDGQAYRGHDVSVAWDAQGGHVAPGFAGYAVYLDGKEIYHAPRPGHVLYNMRGKALANRNPKRDASIAAFTSN